MIFTLKKFRLIGARARIKKTLQIVEDLIPVFQSPSDLRHVPVYLQYLRELNPEARNFQFTNDELQQIEQYRTRITQWVPEQGAALRQPFSPEEKQAIAKTLLKLRHLLNDKIQAPIKESSLIILERDATSCEPLIWPKEVVIVLDHLRSPYNVGAILRTMECVGLHRLISVGFTPRADSRQVQRSAMGCETSMTIEYVQDGVAAIQALQAQHFTVYVLETIIPSRSVFQLEDVLLQEGNIALVVGNEEFGVDESIIAIADQLLHIPTFGKKNSLNVSIAFSICIYQIWSALLGS